MPRREPRRCACITLLVIAASWGAGPAAADDAAWPGEVIVQPPTLICLGFE